ncbi:MAG: IclR family transcriptional regulator [Halanaerobiales bacterium]|nr:IclR family transcriptional regulator [Halanaerobiales bacterium]
MMDKPDQLIKSLDRALNVLEKIVQADRALGVTELSNSLGMHKSSVYRLLATLAYRGYVKQDKNSGYRVGIRLLELSNLVLGKLELRREIKPLLEELMEKSNETIHLGIIDNGEAVYIDKVEPSQTIRMYSSVGKRIPLYCTGIGKVLLAFTAPAEMEKVIARIELKAFTPSTITDQLKFKAHLVEIREKGYALDNVEHEEGVRCVAGPIFDHQGNLTAAFSISGPVMRMTEERLPETIELVKEYTGKMSAVLGYIANR